MEKSIGDKTTIYLTYNTLTRKVTTHLKSKYKLALSGKVSLILGYSAEDVMIDSKKGVAQESPYISTLNIFSTTYTYCDVVEPQIVGDASTQLLQSIPIEGKYGDIVTKTFTNIQYMPVQTKSFENIEILLRTDTGDPVPFEKWKGGGNTSL